MKSSRRNLLIFAGIVAAIYGARAVPWGRFFGSAPDFVAMEGLPPFRTLAVGGSVSAGSPALIGLDQPGEDAAARHARADAARADLCTALFGPGPRDGAVPVAYFSEYRCPYCRALEADLDAIRAADPEGMRLVLHELPIFGPSSELVARASVAAGRQGLQEPFRRAMMRTPIVAEPASIAAVAQSVGVDTDRLARDMASDDVQADLDRSRALADVFGFRGTPGLVIGRTVLNGAVDRHLIERILDDERNQPPLAC
ncbi:MAG: hypothetical protein CL534_23380 [Ahrensia sp.]|nr:hypothetical protein [Ahrensia sp.]